MLYINNKNVNFSRNGQIIKFDGCRLVATDMMEKKTSFFRQKNIYFN